MVEIYEKEICAMSFHEMKKFVHYANALGEIPLLFGGWAVYHYNPYAGSRDVDFIVSDARLNELIDILVKQGYEQREVRLYKDGVFFDLYKKSEDIGSEKNRLPLKLLYEDAQRVYLKTYGRGASRNEVLLPTKSKLLYFKLHALVARSIPKDRTDVIALMLKTEQHELTRLAPMLSPMLKERLLTLRNDAQSLALVTKPTRRNLMLLNEKIKAVVKQQSH